MNHVSWIFQQRQNSNKTRTNITDHNDNKERSSHSIDLELHPNVTNQGGEMTKNLDMSDTEKSFLRKCFLAKILRRLDLRYDLPLLLIAFVLILGAGTVGIWLFFYFSQEDERNTKFELEVYTKVYTGYLDRTVTSSMREVMMLKSYLSIRSGNATLEEFLQFTNSSASLRHDIRSLQWVPRVSGDDVDRFLADTRKIGGCYSNYFIKVKNYTTNEWEPSPKSNVYHPVLWASPLETNIEVLGLDLEIGVNVRDAVHLATTTLKMTASRKVILYQEQKRSTGFVILDPVINLSGDYTGLALGLFQFQPLMKQAMGTLKGVTVAVFDMNNNNEEDSLIYSSLDGSDLKYNEIKKTIENSKQVRYDDIETVNRIYRIYYVAQPSFVANKRSYGRWIALLSPVCISFILLASAVCMVKSLQHSSIVSQIEIEKMELVSETQNRLNIALERINEEEQKTHMIMSGIADPVIAFSLDGEVIHANQSFVRLSEYNLSDLRSARYDILFPYNKDVLNLYQSTHSRLITKSGYTKRVFMSVTRIPSAVVLVLKSPNSEEEEEKVVVALKGEQVNDFYVYSLIQDGFCSELIDFLMDVSLWKSTSSQQEKDQKKKDIYDTYTAPSAVRKLTQLCPKRIEEILQSTSPDPLILFEHEVRQILLFGFIRDIYHKEWNREEDCS